MGRDRSAARLHGLGTTIFSEMSALAHSTGSINLGQGAPDESGPLAVSEAAVEAIRAGLNQYPPGVGDQRLREAVAAHQQRFYGMELDPGSEVVVTAGATEAVSAAILALCDPGDEVLVFEPTYDSYPAAAAMAGASLRRVPLEPPGYGVDIERLQSLVTSRTRLLLLNTPHNPTGKVFSDPELEAIAEVCIEHDLVAVTDEVYEHLVFEGVHRPLATLPGMRGRTITISSAGKTFSFTGWKIGWVCGPSHLVAPVLGIKQFLSFANGAPFQPAVALGLGLGDDVFTQLRDDLRAKRDLLCAGLEAAGFEVFVPHATYFATVDIRPLDEGDGLAFCRSLPVRCGVAAIPTQVFYGDPGDASHLVRFAFCKRREVLEEAVDRLARLRR